MAGLFQSIFGGGGNSAAGYVNAQSGLIKRNSALLDGLNSAYNTALRSGAFDPNAQLDALKADTAYQTGINTGNAAAAARTLGYRPGDSEPILQQNAIGQRAKLDYANQANAIRANATNAGLQAASNLAGQSSNILGTSLQANSGLIQDARQQDAQQGAFFSNLLGTISPFLSNVGRRSPSTSTTPTYYGGLAPGNFIRRT